MRVAQTVTMALQIVLEESKTNQQGGVLGLFLCIIHWIGTEEAFDLLQPIHM